MSVLSKNINRTTNVLKDTLGSFPGARPIMRASGPGQTGQPTDTQGLDIGDSANARANEILKAIQSQASVGTYGEGQLSAANEELRKLQDELSQGKISQKDYVAIGNSIVPSMNSWINQLSSSGSAPAKAIQAGANTFRDVSRDFDIYKTGQEVLGRDLTQNELYQLRPRFSGPNGADTGRAYLAELAQQEAKSPESLGSKAPQYSGQVNDIFQQLMSRGASKDEADYFGRMLATGEVTPYEVNQFVQQLPEYQQQQDKSFRSGLEGELANYDEKAFGREKENILSRYTQAGLQNSSALDFAMTDALSKLAENRGGYLANLTAQQYGGNKAAARQDYQTSLDRLFQGQDYGRGRSDQYLDYLTQRSDQGTDYARQRDDYMNFLNSQPRQRQGSGLGGALGSLAGAGLGGLLGGLPGAQLGGYLGNAGGNAFDYQNY